MQTIVLMMLLAQDADPYEAIRERMVASIMQQRESVRKQAVAVHHVSDTAPGFFTVPWPRKANLETPTASVPVICDPIPPDRLKPMIDSVAGRHGLSGPLLQSVIRRESAGRPCAVSTAGALGLMQLMPDTARTLGVSDPFDPKQNIDGGARFLKEMLNRYGGDLSLALGAYNAGPLAVDRFGGVPPFTETQNYVGNILRDVLRFSENPLLP